MPDFERVEFDDDDDDFELTPELEAQFHRSMQDINDGLFYTMLVDEEFKATREMQCNKCKRIGGWLERPFPHKFECPLRRA